MNSLAFLALASAATLAAMRLFERRSARPVRVRASRRL